MNTNSFGTSPTNRFTLGDRITQVTGSTVATYILIKGASSLFKLSSMRFWHHCARNVDLVSQNVFLMVSAILRKWFGFEITTEGLNLFTMIDDTMPSNGHMHT